MKKLVIVGIVLTGGSIFLILLLKLFMNMSKKIQSPEERITNKLIQMGASKQLAVVILCQAKHETGNFSSFVYRNYNNVFGMKFPVGTDLQMKRRKSLAKSKGKSDYSVYRNIEDSVEDLINWWGYHRFRIDTIPSDIDSYARKLKQLSYFEDTLANYVNGMWRHYRIMVYAKNS